MQKLLMTALLSALSLTIACGDADSGDGTATSGEYDSILALTGDSAAGETLYGNNCSGCHAADGTGSASGPDITGEVPEHSDEEIVATIHDGDGSMPAFADSLADQDIADVLAYLRSVFG